MHLEKKEKKQGDEKEEKVNQIVVYGVHIRDLPNVWGCYVFWVFFFFFVKHKKFTRTSV